MGYVRYERRKTFQTVTTLPKTLLSQREDCARPRSYRWKSSSDLITHKVVTVVEDVHAAAGQELFVQRIATGRKCKYL